MARPKNKEQLLGQAETRFKTLFEFIEGFSETEQNSDFSKGTLNRNIRDVLAHLHHWHLMFFEWYDEGMAGKKPDMPAKGYTWRTLPDLNKKIQGKYSNIDLMKAKSLLLKSHQKALKLLQAHSNEELFTKMRYHWTGSTSLGAYLISCCPSHYDWALKLIKRAKK